MIVLIMPVVAVAVIRCVLAVQQLDVQIAWVGVLDAEVVLMVVQETALQNVIVSVAIHA